MACTLLFRRSLLCGAIGLAVGLPALISNIPISAAPRKAMPRLDVEESGQSTEGDKAHAKEDPKISLNYLRSSWDKVLRDVAAATETELVADRVPKKAFSRMDRKTYTRADALRILNHDLEKEGFRLRFMGKHLVLMETKNTRREYHREVVPARDAETGYATSRPQLDEQGVDSDSRFGKVPASRHNAGRSVLHALNRQHPMTRNIRQVGEEAAAGETVAPPVPQKIRTRTFPLKARKANEIARLVFAAFEKRVKYVEDGPQGLKGIRVYKEELSDDAADPGEDEVRTPRFTIGIDTEKNQLIVDAPPSEIPSVLRLLRLLDTTPRSAQSTLKVVPGIKDPGRVAASLRPELRQLMVAAREGDADAADEKREDDPAGGQAPAPGARPALRPRAGERAGGPAAAAGAAAEAAGAGAIPALKGEVVVEAVPELGIIIIRGNEKDAEAVQSLVREIERLSAGSVPEVYIQPLSNIASESLAALLTAVYDKLAASRGVRPATNQQQQQGQTVSVLPIIRPNALVIIAPAADMESIKELAQKFDLPGEPEGEFRVFFLKNAVASRIVLHLTTLYPQAQTGQGAAGGLATLPPKVLIAGDMRTNSVIVRAEPRDLREVAALIRKLDVDEAASVSQMKIYPLKNAVAEELANTLQAAVQSVLNPPRAAGAAGGGAGQFGGGGAGQGSADLRELKATIIEFIDGDGPAGSRTRSGVVADVRFTADPRTNCLVVTAPPACMEMIEKMVDRLDRAAQAVAEIKVFTLTNGDATAMVSLLERLFNQQAQRGGQGGGGGGGFGQAGGISTGIQIAGAEDAGSTLIPLRFSVDVRTNSVIAIGGAEALRVVEAVLLRLDESDIRQRKNRVYKLKNSYAPNVATAISQFLQTQRQAEQVDPGLISPFEQIEREVVVVAEEASNSLLISATPRYYEEIVELIVKLDEAPKQVLIQALLVEVALDNTDEFGVELGIQDSILFDRSIVSALQQVTTTTTAPNGTQTTTQNIVSQESTPGFAFNNILPLGNNTSPNINQSRLGSQGISNLAVGRASTELGYGGLVLSAGSESVSVLLRALAARRRIDILSRPQIRTLDNQLAQIHVGQEVPRVSGFTPANGVNAASPLIQQRSVGIILTVTPRISPEGIVVMEIAANKDSLSASSVALVTNPNGSIINSPIIDTTNVRSVVGIRSEQTIVLGGMITKNDDVTERKVPILGDIPLLGTLFRYDLKKLRRTELLIFLTPRIVANDAEADLIKEVETQRIHFMQEEAEALHGPIFGVPCETECYLPGTENAPLDFIPPSVLDPQAKQGPTPPANSPHAPPPAVTPDRRLPATPVFPNPGSPPAPGIPAKRSSSSTPLQFDESEVPTTNLSNPPPPPLPPPSQNRDEVSRRRKQVPRFKQIDRSVIQAGYTEQEQEPEPIRSRGTGWQRSSPTRSSGRPSQGVSRASPKPNEVFDPQAASE